MKTREKKGFVRRIPSIIGMVVCVLLAPILIMNLTIVIKSYINPNKVPDFFGIKPFVVTTGSMEPVIYGGDLVIVKTADPSKLKEKDIISFKEGDAVITHRIIKLTETDGKPAFVTKGDANNVEDGNPVSYSQVEGLYLFKISKLGRLALYMQEPIGMFVFVGIPLCGFIIYDIRRRRLADQKEKSNDSEAQAEIERLKAELAAKENSTNEVLTGDSPQDPPSI